jgi:hypothetical protein
MLLKKKTSAAWINSISTDLNVVLTFAQDALLTVITVYISLQITNHEYLTYEESSTNDSLPSSLPYFPVINQPKLKQHTQ